MCPLETGLGATLNESYFSEFSAAVTYITMRGSYAILDAHNYMRYNDPSMQPQSGSIIGNTTDPKAATTENLAAFWTEMSIRFKTNPNVIYGIMNEPHDMPTSLVLKNDQAIIDSIRGAGAQQLILVPGNGFTGAQRWLNKTCDTDCTLAPTRNAHLQPPPIFFPSPPGCKNTTTQLSLVNSAPDRIPPASTL
jgi:endoglucanase